MARGEIRYRLVADASGVEAGVRKAGDALKGLGASASAAGGFMDSLGGKIAAAVSAGAALRFMWDSVKAQDQAMQAINSLNLALSNQGNLLPGVSARLQEYNAALQDRTAFEADAITQAQATLASFGMNEEAIKRTTAAALNFSAATGKDLPTSMELLGKAYAGNTASLSRYGIVLDESVPKSKRFEEAIGQIEQRFAGFAEAQASSFSGGLAQAQNALGDTQEALGKFIGELAGADKPFGAVVAAAKVMTDFFGRDLVIALGESRAQFAEFYASIVRDSAAFAEKVAGSGFLQGAINALGASTGLPLGSFAAGVGRESAADMRAFADGLNQAAVAIRAESDAAAAAAGKTLAFTNGVKQASEASKEAAKAFADAQRYIVDSVDIIDRLESRDVAAGFTGILNVTNQIASGPSREAFNKWLVDQDKATKDAIASTIDWRDALQDVAFGFESLGGVAGRVLGSIASTVASVGSSLKGLNFKGGITGGAGIGGLLGNIGGVLGIAGSVVGLFKGLFGGKDKPEVIPPTWEETFKAAQAAVEQFGIGASKGLSALLGTPGNRRPEAQAYVNQRLGALDGGYAGINLYGEQSAAARASLLTQDFGAARADLGLTKAVDMFQGAFSTLNEKISSQFGPELAQTLLGSIGGLFDAVGNEAVRPALEGMDALNVSLKAASELGYMTAGSFAAYGQGAQDAFKQATDGHLDQKAALEAIAPLLGNIQQAAGAFGFEIDANTQALIDQAKAAGIAFPVDPIERAALAMERVAEHLERIYGLSENVGQSLSGWPTPGGGGVPDYHNPEGYASGGYIPPTPGGRVIRVAEGGEGEYVVPASQMGSGGGMNVNISLSGGGSTAEGYYARLMDGLRINERGIVTEIKKALIQQGAL